MSKMREAFEKLHCGNNPHTTRKNSTTGDYVLPSVQDAWSGFQTGYQAAIAAVKEGDALKVDAERLAWVETWLFGHRWNGVIDSGSATYWSIAPNYRHITQKMVGHTFRDAIDAAMKEVKP